MTKQEYIKQQYGSYWNIVKYHVDGNGWFPDEILGDAIWPLSNCTKKLNHKGELVWRITTLTGLEDNNGWVKVEDSLPSCYMDVEVFDELHEQHTVVFNGERFQTNDSIICHITHWRPKIEYPKPLY